MSHRKGNGWDYVSLRPWDLHLGRWNIIEFGHDQGTFWAHLCTCTVGSYAPLCVCLSICLSLTWPKFRLDNNSYLSKFVESLTFEVTWVKVKLESVTKTGGLATMLSCFINLWKCYALIVKLFLPRQLLPTYMTNTVFEGPRLSISCGILRGTLSKTKPYLKLFDSGFVRFKLDSPKPSHIRWDRH